MAVELGMITIDSTDPRSLAGFWTQALGAQVAQDHGEFLILARAPDGAPGPGLRKVPESRAGPGRQRVPRRSAG